jgi:2-iminobutanoate/2-iminopropanoate deaminase
MSHHLEPLHPATFAPSLAPYSQGVKAGNLVFIAGQVALSDANEVVAPGDVGEQTRVTIDRMRRVLAEAGGSLTDVATATVFLTDLADFPRFNEAWAREFGDHRPARATVRADLALPGLVVEIMATAVLGS